MMANEGKKKGTQPNEKKNKISILNASEFFMRFE